MSRNTGNRSAVPRKSVSSLLTGILIGMVIGVSMAAGLAWYITKAPSPFLANEAAIAKTPVDLPKPPDGDAAPPAAQDAPAALAASGVTDGKPRFEFYKVLTDKQGGTATAPPQPADKPQPSKPKAMESKSAENKPVEGKPAADGGAYFLQAGSFHNADDAEKLKARLALLGFESSTQTATIPDKGVWHRVRTGPYKNIDEMNHARDLLKQNGVEATPTRAQ